MDVVPVEGGVFAGTANIDASALTREARLVERLDEAIHRCPMQHTFRHTGGQHDRLRSMRSGGGALPVWGDGTHPTWEPGGVTRIYALNANPDAQMRK